MVAISEDEPFEGLIDLTFHVKGAGRINWWSLFHVPEDSNGAIKSSPIWRRIHYRFFDKRTDGLHGNRDIC